MIHQAPDGDGAVALENGHFDDAVVHSPAVAVVGKGDGLVDGDPGDPGGGGLRGCGGHEESREGEKRGTEDKP